ncbi:MAG: cobalamin biosynthesis protein CbiM [Clostridiales bacterium 38-18]|nr:MAG: cobalamin biosynthesis protein CbiM [Clostridiales bacterium 38-18]
MHMGDALVSPVVGGALIAATSGVMTYSIKKLDKDSLKSKVAYMGVAGAFVFAAQMINFSIPGTGSSGHIGGGLLLAILLGPSAGFLAMASILLIQALFFADGGLLAYGANVINMGLFTCFLAYPLIYQAFLRLKGLKMNTRIALGSFFGVVIGLQLGALAVVIETVVSGRTELPFSTFLLFMLPIHLAIGAVEGVITATIAIFLHQQQPALLYQTQSNKMIGYKNKIVIGIMILTVFIGGVASLYASGSPDGLEWSISNVSQGFLVHSEGSFLQGIQDKLAILPDYSFKANQEGTAIGTSFSGIIGSFATLILVISVALIIRRASNQRGA